MSWLGYDPERVLALRARTVEALAALRGIRSFDEAAQHAIQYVRLTEQTLDTLWIALLDDIVASTAMVEWRASRLDARCPLDAGLSRWWVATRAGWSDGRLIEEYRATLDAFWGAALLEGVDELDRADLAALLAEIVARARDDTTFLRRMHDELGDDLWLLVLNALEQGYRHRVAVELDQYADELAVGGDLLAMLMAVPGAEADVLQAVIELEVIAPVIGASAASWRTGDLVLLAGHLLDAHRMRNGAVWSRDPTRATAALGAIWRAVAVDPVAARAVLADPEAVDAALTDRAIDPAAVELLVVSALGGATGAGPPAEQVAWEVLGRAITLAGRAPLTRAARRGIGGSIAEYLGPITRDLDTSQITITVRGTPEPVDLGPVAGIDRLLGELLTDEPAQVALAQAVGRFRVDLIEQAIERGREGRLVEHLGERLRELVVLTDRIRAARRAIDDRRAFEDANARALLIGSLDTLVAVGQVAVPGPAAVGGLAARAATWGIHRIAGPTPLDDDPDALARRDTKLAVLAVALHHPELRDQLGVGTVAAATWRDLAWFLSADEGRGPRPDGDLEDLLEHTPELSILVNEVVGRAQAGADGAERTPD